LEKRVERLFISNAEGVEKFHFTEERVIVHPVVLAEAEN